MKIWEGKFKDFKSAKKKSSGNGFSGRKWINEQLINFDKCNDLINKKNKIPYKLTYRHRSFLKILKRIRKKNTRLKILDYGGGYGLGYFYIKKNLKIRFSYTVIEIPLLVKKLTNKTNKFKFITKLDKKNYNFINCCSVFQYINNWKTTINILTKVKSKYLYFSDMFIGNIKSFVTLQNYYGNKIPHWFLNFDDFNNQVIKNGYRLISRTKMETKRLNVKTKLPMENFNLKDRIPYTLNLLYIRI